MNPLNLLTKGRTIRGFGNRSSVYSLTHMGVAPNFSAGRMKSPTPSHPAPETSQSTLFDKPQQPAPAPAMRPPVVALSWPVNAWKRFSALCLGIARRWSAPRKAVPFQPFTVQTELALEKVKVIRNDLSEDDLELVPVAKNENKPDHHEQCLATSTER